MRFPFQLTHGGVVAITLMALACSDGQGPAEEHPTPLPPTPFLVSSPVPTSSPAAADVGRAGSSASAVVYVSLAPGALPDGRTATISDPRLGSAVTATIVDGGFDPVPLAAAAGDTLILTVQTSGGAVPYRCIVADVKRPVVVRTSPPPHKRDVPLNASIVVIFSQPIDPATLSTGSLQLRHDTTPVAGTVRLSDAANLRAEFEPDTLLAGNTDYQLVITTAIHDVNGAALESPTAVEFTTGALVQTATRLVLIVGPGTVGVGQPFVLRAALEDSLGAVVPSASDTVTLTLGTNPGGATLAGTLTVTAVNGMASFDGVRLDRAGAGYTVVAASGSLHSAISSPFTVLQPAAGLVFASVSVGNSYACGVTTAGAAYCWGDNIVGQLGNGTTAGSTTPVPVAGGLTFASVSAMYGHTCGVTTVGDMYCWGGGQVVAGVSIGGGSVPEPVARGLTFASVSVGAFHVCAVTTAGAGYCWGEGGMGELGDSTVYGGLPPARVAGGLTFARISAGAYSSCGLTTGGAVFCWGSNMLGGLGMGASTGPEQCQPDPFDACSKVPVAVTGGLHFKAVDAKVYAACGITIDDTAYCWGSNLNDDLGYGTKSGPDQCPWGETYIVPCSLVPRVVPGAPAFNSISASETYSCGLTSAGVAFCWGYPQGVGDLTSNTAPVAVPGGLTFVALSAGPWSTCGVATGGVAYCWGQDADGELGDGTTTSSVVPVKVAGQP